MRTGGRSKREDRPELLTLTTSLSGYRVGLHVAVKITRLKESLAADLAVVRFLTAVDPLVFGEGGDV